MPPLLSVRLFRKIKPLIEINKETNDVSLIKVRCPVLAATATLGTPHRSCNGSPSPVHHRENRSWHVEPQQPFWPLPTVTRPLAHVPIIIASRQLVVATERCRAGCCACLLQPQVSGMHTGGGGAAAAKYETVLVECARVLHQYTTSRSHMSTK